MSGPKAYTCPPAWVERALGGGLREFYSLQANIADCERRLQALTFTLPDGRHLDGRVVLARTAGERRECMRPLLDGKRRLEEDWRSYLEEAVGERCARVRALATALEQSTSEIEAHADDLETWTMLRERARAWAAAFELHRESVVESLIRHSARGTAAHLEGALDRIRAVALAPPALEFRDGIGADRAALQRALSDAVSAARVAVEAERAALAPSTARRTAAAPPSSAARQSLDATRALIESVEDPAARLAYLDRLERLVETWGVDLHHLDELHDDILALEHTHSGRLRISAALDTVRHAGSDATELEAEGRELLARERLDPRLVNAFLGRVEAFERAAREAAARRFVEQQGRELLRRSVVDGLEQMGYQVATDLQTVDFSRTGEILLEVPGQQNAVSLRFQEGDRLSYRFLVPERTADPRQLHEMEAACDDFKRVLDALRGIGVELKLQAEVGVSRAALVELSEQQRAALRGFARRGAAPGMRSRRRED